MEVGLIVAVIAIVVLGAVKLLGGGSDETFTEAAAAVDEPPAGGGGGGSGGGGSGGGGSGGGGGGGSGGGGGATSTTAAPTTTSTTAAPTTTTTRPPTTTTTMPPLGSGYPTTSGFKTPTVQANGSSKRANTSVVVRNSSGQPVAGATATVTIFYEERSGNSWVWKSTTVTVTTGANGAVDVSSAYYPTSGSNRVRTLRFELTSSNAPGWDGVKHSQSVSIT